MSKDITVLLGKTVVHIVGGEREDDEILFVCSDGEKFKMWHNQDCCESVTVEDVAGDLQDLIGSPILQAEESTSEDVVDGKPEYPESWTWTFYKLATAKGYVTIRWLGQSNGYYSESVEFDKIN